MVTTQDVVRMPQNANAALFVDSAACHGCAANVRIPLRWVGARRPVQAEEPGTKSAGQCDADFGVRRNNVVWQIRLHVAAGSVCNDLSHWYRPIEGRNRVRGLMNAGSSYVGHGKFPPWKKARQRSRRWVT